MLWFLFILLVAAVAAVLGARYHAQVNAKVAKILGTGTGLPAEFELWLANHKGEYESIGKAMGAWADAKFGSAYDKLLKKNDPN